MSKINTVFKRISYIFGIIFIIELFTLASFIDLIPFFFTGLISGIIIAIKHRSDDDTLKDISIFRNDIFSIIFTLLLCFITVIIGILFAIIGVKNIANSILVLLNTSIYFRFAIYGFLFPIINTFFINWCVTGYSPFEHISVSVFTWVLVITLFIGLFLCMLWDYYYIVAEFILNLV